MQKQTVLAVIVALWATGTQAHESTGSGGEQRPVTASGYGQQSAPPGPVQFQQQLDGKFCWSTPDNVLRNCGVCDFSPSSATGRPNGVCYPTVASGTGYAPPLIPVYTYTEQTRWVYHSVPRVLYGIDGLPYTNHETVPQLVRDRRPVTIYTPYSVATTSYSFGYSHPGGGLQPAGSCGYVTRWECSRGR